MLQFIENPVLMMVDDDDEDIYLTRRAFCNYKSDLVFSSVYSGAEMFDYLYRRGEYSDDATVNTPDVILLDINIPKVNGFEILEKLRADEKFSHLPAVMLTTSSAAHDIQSAYRLGANSYICKSVSSQGMQQVASQFCDYWFGFSKLPTVALQ